MSDAKQPEQMRPIPDGGLKEAMPSWLKRPPAWRDLPTAEQRHERSLPEPDTSEIDPRSLVDVSDLPQWLQAIAARGDIPVPAPDASVDHAVEVVQAVQQSAPVPSAPEKEPNLIDSGLAPERGNATGDTSISETTLSVPDEITAPTAASPASEGFTIPVWILPLAALVVIALLVTIVVLI